MNLILFAPSEIQQPLPRTDRRAVHILDVLRRQPGDALDVGLINGPRGKATLVKIDPDGLTLAFSWAKSPPAVEPLTLIVGLPRPQTARDILRDATTLGVAALHFIRTEKSEASYAQSNLWTSDEWRRHVVAGAEQAFDTRVPVVSHGRKLADIVAELPPDASRLALDNYEALAELGNVRVDRGHPLALALGGERGWSNHERSALRGAGFTLVHLGRRVLRTETAVVAALAILRFKLGLMS